MKVWRITVLGFACFAGCGPKEASLQKPLSEAAPVASVEAKPIVSAPQVLVFDDGTQPPAEINEGGWVERQSQTSQVLDSLREHAQRVGPEDGFSLTEAEIQELSKKYDELVLY